VAYCRGKHLLTVGFDVQIALFQPDIAANVGAVIRLAACLDVPLTVIEPCGFVWDQRRVRRVGLDYLQFVALARAPSFAAFEEARRVRSARLVLLTTRASQPYHAIAYRPDDILLAGQESSGVPEVVHAAADLRVRVPMAPGRRSLNVVTALAMVLGEALRQTEGFVSHSAPAHALRPAAAVAMPDPEPWNE
jgi:tRNA (cytidine/uridine-2'-O-)-methyltransferase